MPITDIITAFVYLVVSCFFLAIFTGCIGLAGWLAVRLFGYELPKIGLSVMQDFRDGSMPLAQFLEEYYNPTGAKALPTPDPLSQRPKEPSTTTTKDSLEIEGEIVD